jgi:AraC family transcriptional regulator of adaptative response/methylated-DNA-[protein]-cysteine methyltransferase
MYPHYPLVEQALKYIEKNFREQPDLESIASHLDISPYHLQRIFKEWVGISPKRFLQFLTIDHARKLLQESRSVLEATFESGLSSPGRIHDLFINIDAVTPGEYKEMGSGLRIEYSAFESPFGRCAIAATNRGLCFMGFYDQSNFADFETDMKSRFPMANFSENETTVQPYFDAIFNKGAEQRKINLFVHGTNFQVKVWEALIRIPEGLVCSYQDIARLIGQPKASRAVGSAVGSNPISYLIPCHRVIRSMGVFGDYHWGSARKKAMLLWESEKIGKKKESTMEY